MLCICCVFVPVRCAFVRLLEINKKTEKGARHKMAVGVLCVSPSSLIYNIYIIVKLKKSFVNSLPSSFDGSAL